jgi:hypothetical protein
MVMLKGLWHLEPAMPGRAASTRGQATIEYLVVMAAVAALAGLVLGALSGVGHDVTSAFACTIGRVGGDEGSCGRGGSSLRTPDPPPPPTDGLSDRERAARELQPGRYDDVPGTAQERMNTTTPPPPGGDQCSFSPDHVPGLYDFSYACYAHDLCWQNATMGGSPMTIGQCNDEFRRRMRDHCDRRNTGFGSGFRENLCFDAADTYFAAVSAAGVAKTIHDCPGLAAATGPAAAMYLCRPQH